ncbi:hypothetical protein RHMOL_Rhmol13G0130700 [Rhododendron molle]|uniref:Uncharacterized protein n=1 Tax=Rhododendron molle TaxID=49168 RepID=A0ACC0L6P3_RHOML|nr:hypothetical protein RHMOL_Rhmol13G0130700 [Rhododendron molle]
MVVRVPFHRWVHVKYRSLRPMHGGFYSLLPVQGQRMIAAVARYRHPAQLECKAFSLFVLYVFALTMVWPRFTRFF